MLGNWTRFQSTIRGITSTLSRSAGALSREILLVAVKYKTKICVVGHESNKCIHSPATVAESRWLVLYRMRPGVNYNYSVGS